MKTWWLKLYTIPSFKQAATWFAYWLLADLVAKVFLSSISDQLILPLLGVFGFTCVYCSHDFFEHFDFHKNSVGFKELQKIAVLEFCFSFFSRILLFFTVVAVSKIYGGSGELILRGLTFMGTFSTLLMYTLLVMSVTAIFRIGRANGKPKKLSVKFHKNFIVHFILFVFVGICSFVFSVTGIFSMFMTSEYFGSMAICMAIALLAITSFVWFETSRGLFHHPVKTFSPIKAPFQRLLRFTVYYVPASFILVFAFWPLAQLDHKIPFYTFGQQAATFHFWGNLSPDISEEQFVSFTRQSTDPDEIALAYDKAPFQVRKWPLQSFIKNPSLPQVLGYLRKGNPSQAELRTFAQHLTPAHLQSNLHAKYVAIEIIRKWPRNQELPVVLSDHLLEHKKRQIASELPKLVK